MASIPHSPGIYQILCVPTGKIYIGSTVDLAGRWIQHQSTLRRGSSGCVGLLRAWKKYGADAFEFSVLEGVLLVEMLIEREQYWLDRLRPYEYDRGFNIRRIADKNIGWVPSAETRQKISRTLTGQKQPRDLVERRNASLRGRKQPREAVERLRAINRTKSRTPEMKAHWSHVLKERGHRPPPESYVLSAAAKSKWYVVTDQEGTSRLIKNMRAFCREQGIHHSGLYRVLAGEFPTYRGWKARHATDEEIHASLLVPT